MENQSNTEPKNRNKKFDISIKEIILNVVIPFVTFILGIVVTNYVPEKESKTVLKNRIGGNNQRMVRKMPAVQSFEEYIGYIESKDTAQMWSHSTAPWQTYFRSTKNMYYQYYLTSKYEVKYIIPISENSFYAYMRFEDDVIDGEMRRLKEFHYATLARIGNEKAYDEMLQDVLSFVDNRFSIDSAELIKKELKDYIKIDNENIFEEVLEEVYRFIDNRFVIDSAEYVKEKLRVFMMNMALRDYITQDWRFPMNFAQDLQLPIKQCDENRFGSGFTGLGVRQGHDMISLVEMVKEKDGWKLNKFQTIAITRWK